ncbi:M23 family metallopeptidase [Leucobacter chromiireducens]|uniref:M23 family metallopeptidase n=1 Tax=Leucobacter chromiireducens TaxID=283877 RepID=UPI000F63B601|nr:M23 family metallopeptidase [Leucobacter chromiireducens]
MGSSSLSAGSAPRTLSLGVLGTLGAFLLTVSPGASARPPPLAPSATGAPGAQHTDAALWRSPLAGALDVSGAFRAPETPYTSGHRGVDLPAVPGELVSAPAAGTVTFAGTVVDRPLVSVRVDDATVYSLEPVSSTVTAGQRVVAGAQLGEAARGGHCAAECVHLGVRVDDEYVSPMRFLLGRPVLLPWRDAPAALAE